ncbi:MAG: hypothetical protein JNJ98_03860, partial [Gemmatimonadetes bacterium]|nr:hypothetical protein [Gemmatimonadota bacterium]
MDDTQLDALIHAADRGYRPPPAPDLDRLWDGIAARRQRPAAPPRWRWVTPLAIAATATIAFSLGRVTARPAAEPVAQAPVATAPVSEVANDLLGQTVVLLSRLPQEPSLDATAFARQAGDLLVTTRLLLDAPDTQRNPTLAGVLRDLELVLAQVARLRDRAPSDELELITDAMRDQDLVPRIRTVAAR